MLTERMSRRKSRVLKIVGGIVAHRQFLHYTARAQIRRNSERNNLFQAEGGKGILRNYLSALRRQTLAPVACSQTPADFHTGREACMKFRHVEADEPDEEAFFTDFCPEHAEAVLPKVRFGTIR